jgi:type VI secretion system protein ImpL
MRLLFGEIARQTTLAAQPTPAESGRPGASGALPAGAEAAVPPALGKPLKEIFGGPASAARSPLRFVDERFRPLHDFVRGRDGAPALIEETLRTFSTIYLQLNQVAASATPGQLLLNPGGGGDRAAASQRLRGEASRAPEAIARIVARMAEGVSSITSSGFRRELNQKWRADVLPLCSRALPGRYPFDRSSRIDVTLDDFGRLFAPGGLIDGFFKDNLASFADTGRVPWRWQRADVAELGISSASLIHFQRAAAIRDAFFPAGSKEPGIGFELAPLSLDGDSAQVLLDVNNQTMMYAHGPIKSVRMKWPGDDAQQVRLAFSPAGGGQPASITKTGAWAWFRLIDEAAVQKPGLADRFEITLSAAGHRASFELRANSVVNPFALRELGEFRCPETL